MDILTPSLNISRSACWRHLVPVAAEAIPFNYLHSHCTADAVNYLSPDVGSAGNKCVQHGI